MSLNMNAKVAPARVPEPISEVAATIGLEPSDFDSYGPYKAKVHLDILDRLANAPDGKLILVTGITPTTAGEGKTTVAVGLAQALFKMGKKALSCTREPSLGPVFGMKGGATGGGLASLIPMEDINLHFTGDFHAITAAHNLLSAVVDNHLHHGNQLGIDPRRIAWRRVLDMNDRALRNVVTGLGGRTQGVPRESGFDITPASEVMAILCLARDLADLKERLGRIIVGETFDRQPVTASDLKAHNAMTILLRDALMPNLVQNLEHGPAIVHGGPFGNIAHGCNSNLATRLGLKLGDYVITEAGFGSDLGAEKFVNIACRAGGFAPDTVVLVASVRALKLHGGTRKSELATEDISALNAGFPNLEKHVENIAHFGSQAIVALNRFPTDSDAEVRTAIERCQARGIPVAETTVYTEGTDGGNALAEAVLHSLTTPRQQLRMVYPDEWTLKKKIEAISHQVYGAEGVSYSVSASRTLRQLERRGFGRLPVCMAKTQYSLSDNARLLARPTGFEINVGEVRLAAGAGFVIPLTGAVMTMPGLPATPAAAGMAIDANGQVTGIS